MSAVPGLLLVALRMLFSVKVSDSSDSYLHYSSNKMRVKRETKMAQPVLAACWQQRPTLEVRGRSCPACCCKPGGGERLRLRSLAEQDRRKVAHGAHKGRGRSQCARYHQGTMHGNHGIFCTPQGFVIGDAGFRHHGGEHLDQATQTRFQILLEMTARFADREQIGQTRQAAFCIKLAECGAEFL